MKVEAVIILLIFCVAKLQARLEDCSVKGITWSSDEQHTVIPLIRNVEECAIICDRCKCLQLLPAY